MAPKAAKGKKQKQSLGDFLGVKVQGTSWADDDDDDAFIAPEKPGQGEDYTASTDWRGSRSQPAPGGGDRPFANLAVADKPLPDKPPYTLYIGNLSYSTTEEEIQEFFKNSESARLVYDKMTKEPKGFGYVSFPTREDLANALKLDNQSLGGRSVRLDIAQDNRSGEKGGGKGKGSRFGDGGGGFSGFSGGRDFMGTGQVERGTMGGGKAEGGRGMDRGGFGSGRGGGASLWEEGRDVMGSGQSEERSRGPPRDGPRELPAFSRDTMGSEQSEARSGYSSAPRESRGAFGGAGGDSWSGGREAMGTGVVERRDPPAPREDRPERLARELPAFSRDAFGAEEAPEPPALPEPEEKPKPQPWRPGAGRAAAAANLGDGGSWRDNTDEDDKPKKPERKVETQTAKANPFLARSSEPKEEPKKEKKEREIPKTQEELFQQQIAKAKKKEEAAKAAKEKENNTNINMWSALGAGKKKKR
uniref:RRM domain-containing protein n=1 Tax=Eutreptiella gymnastica TaxID=73025 RepID=A0A7S1N5G5_9EUGL|mmetsp:Transcript_119605/g.208273  ORF Transcript_119605/g.208273 Transcript_119605/m.208273 type:complete len:474 (+) Transcript_119605:64-1485(+)